MEKQYRIGENDTAVFNNQCTFCIGTGRLGLALHKEYYDQLEYVQGEIGFSYIRGHGMFSDDMGIYNEYTSDNGEVRQEFNYTYIDRVLDSYQSLKIKPFLEIGFMPKALASGNQTIFYWKGNVTPPKDYDLWANLIRNFFEHIIARYGLDEVSSWPVEIWNEPNLPVFWKDADMNEYFKLYNITAKAIKSVSSRFRVGGPSICGGDSSLYWIKSFLDYCQQTKSPLDFITRHIYMANFPEKIGRYEYHTMKEVSDSIDEAAQTRAIIDSYPEFKGMELHITEFNTSYTSRCPIHDTNQNAAMVAGLLSSFGDSAASYSYWTFGDVFEEQGVPFTPFHGGFGLVANGSIPKPVFWTFAFFNKLHGEGVLRTENAVVVKQDNGGYRGVLWNIQPDGLEELNLSVSLPACNNKECVLLTAKVDGETCNPAKVWHDLGGPSSLSEDQYKYLLASAKPLYHTENRYPENSESCLTFNLKPNAVVYFEFTPITRTNDRGYDFNWYK